MSAKLWTPDPNSDEVRPVGHAFKPVQPQPKNEILGDTTGISVNRQKYIEPKALAERTGKHHVVCIEAARVTEHEMTIQPDPLEPDDLGHAVIPEITWEAYSTDKAATKERMRYLADNSQLCYRKPS